MKAEQVKKGWQTKSEEINQGIAEWRQAHARATLEFLLFFYLLFFIIFKIKDD